ncbi:hypothetical protein I3843_06G063800 [Carya illinoinensis]|uniref:Uncharacterized protein n=1 Tax=Carya illinoinensis TaxID=32201 RepID=A0A922ERI8_CARIL|nr:hypothetical protein I3842_06G068900 [Carya illinoinensis]KAG7974747.1 hypothetical protein I3843_06G063800 [Carya illinoinensis]
MIGTLVYGEGTDPDISETALVHDFTLQTQCRLFTKPGPTFFFFPLSSDSFGSIEQSSPSTLATNYLPKLPDSLPTQPLDKPRPMSTQRNLTFTFSLMSNMTLCMAGHQ